eukprot:gene7116-14469_t
MKGSLSLKYGGIVLEPRNQYLYLKYLQLSVNLEDEEVFEILSNIIKDSLLPGIMKGRDYIPTVYSQLQRTSVDHFFQTNGYIEYSRIKKFQISKPLEYLQIFYPDSIGLKTCAASSGLLHTLSVELEELQSQLHTTSNSTSTNTTGVEVTLPWMQVGSTLPTVFDTEDCEMLLKICMQSNNSTATATATDNKKKSQSQSQSQNSNQSDRSFNNLIVLGSDIVVNKSYLNKINTVFAADAVTVATEICLKKRQQMNASRTSTSTSSDGDKGGQQRQVEDEDDVDDRGKKKKKSATKAAIDEDNDSDDDNNRGGGGDGGGGGKGSKGNKRKEKEKEKDIEKDKKSKKNSNKSSNTGNESSNKSSTSTSTGSDVKTLLASYLKQTRCVDIIRSHTAGCKNFNVEVDNDNDEDSDNIDIILNEIWSLVESEVKEMYVKELSKSLETLQQGDLADRRRRESLRDATFENEWTELLVIARGLAVLKGSGSGCDKKENEKDDSTSASTEPLLSASNLRLIEDYILHTRCTRICWAITTYCAWEVGMTVEECPCPVLYNPSQSPSQSQSPPLLAPLVDPIEVEVKQKLLKQLPKEVNQVLNKLWNLCMTSSTSTTDATATSSEKSRGKDSKNVSVTGGSSSSSSGVGEFIEILDTYGQRAFQLVVRKADKKRDKQTVFGIRQNLLELLRNEDNNNNNSNINDNNTILRTLQIATALFFYQAMNTMVDIPPSIEAIEALVSCIEASNNIPEDHILILRNILRLMIKNNSNSNSTSSEEGVVANDSVDENIVTLKDIFLNKKH